MAPGIPPPPAAERNTLSASGFSTWNSTRAPPGERGPLSSGAEPWLETQAPAAWHTCTAAACTSAQQAPGVLGVRSGRWGSLGTPHRTHHVSDSQQPLHMWPGSSHVPCGDPQTQGQHSPLPGPPLLRAGPRPGQSPPSRSDKQSPGHTVTFHSNFAGFRSIDSNKK